MVGRPEGCWLSSLSARRAWIEITVVATLATLVTSLSARRAWIEIEITLQTVLLVSVVALRKESVDRNKLQRHHRVRVYRRSPQGERG